jgi:transposase
MRILALDLGTTSTKTHGYLLDTQTGHVTRPAITTSVGAFLDLLRNTAPDLVVAEPTPITGVLVDTCRAQEIPVKILNVRDPAWQNRTNKTDRNDAELMANLVVTGHFRTVDIPSRDIREWRAQIAHRHNLVRERTRIKNRIKSTLNGELIPAKSLWSKRGLKFLHELTLSPERSASWRAILSIDLERYHQVQAHVTTATQLLDDRLLTHPHAEAILALPGVGPRLAESLLAHLVTAQRFHDRKAVAAYVGICPRVQQSGKFSHYGRITKAGNTQLRTLLIEVAQLGARRPGWMRDIYIKNQRGDKSRSNRAITAVARRLLVRCWAILRDREKAPEPTPATVAA